MDDIAPQLIEALRQKRASEVAERIHGLVAVGDDAPAQLVLRWHPLGFVHGTVGRVGDTAVRLHIWHPSLRRIQDPAWLVHDHVWDLESLLLAGELTNEDYLSEQAPDGDRLLYTVAYNEQTSVLASSGLRVFSELDAATPIPVHETYRVSRGAFHSTTVPLRRGAVTLALAKDEPGPPARVVGEVMDRESFEYVRQVLRPNERSRVLDWAMRAIERS